MRRRCLAEERRPTPTRDCSVEDDVRSSLPHICGVHLPRRYDITYNYPLTAAAVRVERCRMFRKSPGVSGMHGHGDVDADVRKARAASMYYTYAQMNSKLMGEGLGSTCTWSCTVLSNVGAAAAAVEPPRSNSRTPRCARRGVTPYT